MNKLKKSGEDYLEIIYELEMVNPKVRSIDIANKLGVSRPSVNKAMGKLIELDMVKKELYGDVYLTEKGRNYARQVLSKHTVLREFLSDIVGVNEKTADDDACKIEHIISDESMSNIRRIVCDNRSKRFLEAERKAMKESNNL